MVLWPTLFSNYCGGLCELHTRSVGYAPSKSSSSSYATRYCCLRPILSDVKPDHILDMERRIMKCLLVFWSLLLCSVVWADRNHKPAPAPPRNAPKPSAGYVWVPTLAGVTVTKGGVSVGPVIKWAGVTPKSAITNGQRYTVTMSDGSTVTYYGHEVGDSLILEVSGAVPVSSFILSALPGTVVPTPYCTAEIRYDRVSDLFCSAYCDWNVSQGSSMNDSLTQVYYAPHVPVNERIVITIDPLYEHCLPLIPNPASPNRQQMADSVVVDNWTSGFATTEAQLKTLNTQGIKNVLLLNHVWQYGGYDRKYPTVLPAGAQFGGDVGLRQLLNTAQQCGYVVALHENYSDAYTDSTGYTQDWLALSSSGVPYLAWLNPDSHMQAHAIKATQMLPLAQQNRVVQTYGLKASFLDVHSSESPWAYTDFDTRQALPGRMGPRVNANKELWAYERAATLGGPVLGEGGRHWMYSGLLDGVEAEVRGMSGPTLPLNVAFELLRIHPLQMNHGMGYYNRWGTLDIKRYRMQQIIFGHSAYVDRGGLYADVEYNVCRTIASKHALAMVSKIEYLLGGQWQSISAAAKANDFSHVRVTWDNGLVVEADNSTFKWSAVGAGISFTSDKVQ